jgi:cytochrome c553
MTTLQRLLPALLASLVLAAAGCGGDDEGGGDGGGGGGGGGSTEQQAGGPAETFSSTCGNCHTLQAAGTEGQVGPNLDDLKPDEGTVREAIRQGPGVMPENLLEGAEADAVAKYVADNAGG